ncbi:hypothetical protein Tco_1112609 [Tanacetum coccineum]|uniref:Uncharacterized protein n=1 Tax=Tanacetum coccineum TaxID=301880 RepID=A0ABQ5IR34_9ASTR
MQAVRNTNVIKPGMYRIACSTTQTRAPQLNQTSRNNNPRVSTSTGVTHKTNVSRPQPRSNQMKDKVVPNTSHVKFKKTEVEEHPRISSISNQTKSVTAYKEEREGIRASLVGLLISQRDIVSTTRERLIVNPLSLKFDIYDNPDRTPELQNVSPSADTIVPSQQELDLLFGPLYDEFFNDGTSRVNKSSSPTDNSAPQDTHPSTNIHPTSEPTTQTNVHAEENNDNQAEFTNPFCTLVQEIAESSSPNIGNSNVHTFNQPQHSEYRWTKDHRYSSS